MNRHDTDILARLAEANPVQARELRDGTEPAWVEALLERIVDAPADEPSRSPRRDRRRPQRVGLAGALVAAAVVVGLLGGGGQGADPVAEAEAALSSPDGVFHVVTQITTSQLGSPATQLWMETWAAVEGHRSHSLVYSVDSRGGRGRLLGETVGRRDGELDSVTYAAPPGGAAFPASGEPAAERPLSYVLALLRSGKVTDKRQVTFAGREAWRVTIVRHLGRSSIVSPRGRATTPPYTEGSVLIIDGRSHLPLFLRSTGLVPTEPDRSGGRLTFPNVTSSRRFTRFERLTDSAGAAGLKPSFRFNGRH